jgi:O-acetyl-ADP-ribose deacetylase (regulator of RNase III)
MQIQIAYSNIVHKPDADAVVNPANANLRLGSGIAGAIHPAERPNVDIFECVTL